MQFLSDILLIFGSCFVGLYCLVLSRRVRKLNDLEKGVGGAIAVLSTQVDEMNKVLVLAKERAASSSQSLETLTERAQQVAGRLEVLVASMHDLPGSEGAVPPINNQIEAVSNTDTELANTFRSGRHASEHEVA